MRIKLLLTLGLVILFSSSFAQTIYLKPGLTISTIDWAINPGGSEIKFFEDPLFSFGVTAGIEYLERKNFSLASELLFYESGGTESEENSQSGSSKTQKANLQYLSLGTYFNFNPLDRAWKLQVQLGPRIDYLVGGYNKSPFLGYNNSRKIERFQYGYNIGLGVYYNYNELVFGLSASYLGKLSKVVDYEPDHWDGAYAMPAQISDQGFLIGMSIGYKLSKD